MSEESGLAQCCPGRCLREEALDLAEPAADASDDRRSDVGRAGAGGANDALTLLGADRWARRFARDEADDSEGTILEPLAADTIVGAMLGGMLGLGTSDSAASGSIAVSVASTSPAAIVFFFALITLKACLARNPSFALALSSPKSSTALKLDYDLAPSL